MPRGRLIVLVLDNPGEKKENELMVPFGFPVVPEVKMTYAGSLGTAVAAVLVNIDFRGQG